MKFPRNFFEEEEREGFTIIPMMKRAWAAELEVLEVVRSVCAKHDIKWYAVYGTLLGAVRHKGFIPWDDDIDICMLRDDYMRFMSIAPQALPEGFVISGIYGDCPRLWEANTEPQGRVIADEIHFTLPEYMNYFHAFPYMRIGIDIFPIDNMPSDPQKQLELVNKIFDLQRIARMWPTLKAENQLESRLHKYEKELDLSFNKDDEILSRHEILCAIDQYACSVPASESDAIGDILYSYPPKTEEGFTGFRTMKEEWFGEGKEWPYECGTIIVPSDPDRVLTVNYGEDYMTPKPFTADHEYPFYKIQEEAFIKLWKEAGKTSSVEEFCSNWHKMIGGE
ncbi:LicD family protein [Butyrivibrio fibrisolvens]|uniref:LicD family protein n=1 Tax=Butyrivibrio fibrisolvens TaxID=831 RepID=UPI000420259B|nr:LicD family protein [Butyrivibrio fibrisolvens]